MIRTITDAAQKSDTKVIEGQELLLCGSGTSIMYHF
jgi:hypothetical protein